MTTRYSFVPPLFSLTAIIFIVLILAAGTNNALTGLYYVKTNTVSLSLPSKLSGSDFLADISQVSGTDLVGPNITSSTLGLADSYSLLLLTSCAHYANGTTCCAHPTIGFNFNYGTNLRLDSTSLTGSFPNPLLDAQAAYHRVSPFIGVAYIISINLLVIALAAGRLTTRVASIVATTLFILATIFLLAAGIAATVTFRNLSTQLNAAYPGSGMISPTGTGPLVLGFLAFTFSLISMIVIILQNRTKKRNRMEVDKISTIYQGADINVDTAKPGLWKRMPTFGSHKYVQVEKQPVTVETTHLGGAEQQAVVVTSPTGYVDTDWAHAQTGYGREAGIPMRNMPGDELQAGRVYEPFMTPGGRG